MPKIVAAAIKDPEGKVWSLPAPARHENVIRLMCSKGARALDSNEGFLTDEGVFVDRLKAASIARAAGQVKRPVDVLASTDLW